MLSRSSAAGRRSAVRCSRRAGRSGLTLLEVIISVAIFLLALVGLANLVSLGSDLALEAKEQTEALHMAQAKLSQVIAGVIPLQGQTNVAIPPEEAPNRQDGWNWTLECSQTDINGTPALWKVR